MKNKKEALAARNMQKLINLAIKQVTPATHKNKILNKRLPKTQKIKQTSK